MFPLHENHLWVILLIAIGFCVANRKHAENAIKNARNHSHTPIKTIPKIGLLFCLISKLIVISGWILNAIDAAVT